MSEFKTKTRKEVVNKELTAEELKKHLKNGLVSIKRSGSGICLTFKSEGNE